jgi:hypothetical protein
MKENDNYTRELLTLIYLKLMRVIVSILIIYSFLLFVCKTGLTKKNFKRFVKLLYALQLNPLLVGFIVLIALTIGITY